MLFRRPSASGISPLSKFILRFSSLSWDNMPSYGGMLPESWLLWRSSLLSAERLPIAGEMMPVRLELERRR